MNKLKASGPDVSYSYSVQMPNYVLVESKHRAEDLGRGIVYLKLYTKCLSLSWKSPYSMQNSPTVSHRST